MNINLFMDFEKVDTVEEINTYVSASSPTISAKMKKIIDEYPAGSTWTKTYGPSGDSECKGFAQMIYKKYFGVEQYDSVYYWTALSQTNAKKDNSLVFTKENAKRIINKLPIGTYMRVITARTSTIHSFIIAAKNADYVTIYECNMQRDGVYCSVSLTTMTYEKFVSDYNRLLYFSNGKKYASNLNSTMYLERNLKIGAQAVGSTNNIVYLTLEYDKSNKKVTATATTDKKYTNKYRIAIYGEEKDNKNLNKCITNGNFDNYEVKDNAISFSKYLYIKEPGNDWQFYEASLKINNENTAYNIFWFMTYAGDSKVGN